MSRVFILLQGHRNGRGAPKLLENQNEYCCSLPSPSKVKLVYQLRRHSSISHSFQLVSLCVSNSLFGKLNPRKVPQLGEGWRVGGNSMYCVYCCEFVPADYCFCGSVYSIFFQVFKYPL